MTPTPPTTRSNDASTPYRFGGKVIGTLEPDGTLVQHRRAEHFLHAVGGFSLAFVVLHDPRVERIETHWQGRTYTVTTDFWRRHGVPWRNGIERQLALPLSACNHRDAGQESLLQEGQR